MRRERTMQKPRFQNYGEGGPPEWPTVIVSSEDGNGITAGREYPVTIHRAFVYVVLNDNGHERVFSMHSDTHAHAHFYDNNNPPYARVWEDID